MLGVRHESGVVVHGEGGRRRHVLCEPKKGWKFRDSASAGGEKNINEELTVGACVTGVVGSAVGSPVGSALSNTVGLEVGGDMSLQSTFSQHSSRLS